MPTLHTSGLRHLPMGNTYWKIWIVHPSSLQTLHDGSIPDNVMDSTSINLRGHLRMGIYTWGFGSCILGLWWHLTNGRLDTSLLMDAYRPFGDQMPLRNILRMHCQTSFLFHTNANEYVCYQNILMFSFLHFLPLNFLTLKRVFFSITNILFFHTNANE